MSARRTHYCRRVRLSTGRVGWTGPLPLARAQAEVAAWREATDSLDRHDWEAELVEATPEVRAEVRAWEKAR
jgi:hypothetical protein